MGRQSRAKRDRGDQPRCWKCRRRFTPRPAPGHGLPVWCRPCACDRLRARSEAAWLKLYPADDLRRSLDRLLKAMDEGEL